MYIHEAPIHFGLIMASWILLLIGTIVALRTAVSSEENRERNWFGFLFIFFLFFVFSIFAVMIYQLPATATVDQILPYTLGIWSTVSLYALFSVYYWFTFDYFAKRRWLMYLFFIGTIGFLAMVWFFATPATMTIVSDGIMNWLVMPFIVVAAGGILAIIYFFLMDFIAMYQLNKTREGRIWLGNWIVFIGGLLVNLSLVLMALMQYLAPFLLIVFALTFVGLFIMFLGGFINIRAVAKQK